MNTFHEHLKRCPKTITWCRCSLQSALCWYIFFPGTFLNFVSFRHSVLVLFNIYQVQLAVRCILYLYWSHKCKHIDFCYFTYVKLLDNICIYFVVVYQNFILNSILLRIFAICWLRMSFSFYRLSGLLFMCLTC